MKTIATVSLLFLALALHPEVQKRAQDELDAVVGRDRLPTFDDRHCLPYIEAMCREVFRWRVVIPIGSIILYQLRKVGGAICYFQEFLMRHVRMMFIRDFSFRKVHIALLCHSVHH